MSRKPIRIICILLAAALLAGCAYGHGVPGGTTGEVPNLQDMYIAEVPLIPSNQDPTQGEEPPESKPTQPQPTQPKPTEPKPTEPKPTEPQPAEPKPTEPKPTEPQPTEPKPTEPQPTEPQPTQPQPTEPEPTKGTNVSTGEALENDTDVLPSGGAAVPEVASPVASGTKVKSNAEATIDYSNTEDGYVMVQYTGATDKRLKVQIKGPKTTYTYNLTPGQWAAFPLSDENGNYKITIYKNVTGTKYASALSLSISVTMEDEFSPFIRSNQYVNFDAAPNTVAKAASVAGNMSDPLKKVEAVYNFVVRGMTYDTQLAATVTSGYLPDLDSVLSKMSGICFDYAALMTGMLRSQGVPTKLVVGYAGDVYHAWIHVWSESTGWVDGIIYFDGMNWKRMDPTFASSGGANSDIMDYIGDGSNYSAKYFY